MTESGIRAKCRRCAKSRGFETYKLDPTGQAGAFDRLYCGPNAVMFFVEHKQPDGRKRPHQIVEQKKLRAKGFVAEFCWTFEQFEALLDRMTA